MTMTTEAPVKNPTPSDEKPWQLKMLAVSVKKMQKLNGLIKHLSPPVTGKCLLITCGDNNGAINYRLRECGGDWSFCDLEPQNVEEMSELLGEKVLFAESSSKLPYEDNTFDHIVTIDCQEHLDDPIPFTKEVARIVKPGGRAILTVPNGNEKKIVVRMKNMVGMTKEFYGHVVVGYDVHELEEQAKQAGLEKVKHSSYSKFFTEILELGINFMYVKVLSKGKASQGQIAPTSQGQMKKVGGAYKLYRILFPFFKLFSFLDVLCPTRGYAVTIEVRKNSGK